MSTYNILLYFFKHHNNRVFDQHITKVVLGLTGPEGKFKYLEQDFLGLSLLAQVNPPGEVNIVFAYTTVLIPYLRVPIIYLKLLENRIQDIFYINDLNEYFLFLKIEILPLQDGDFPVLINIVELLYVYLFLYSFRRINKIAIFFVSLSETSTYIKIPGGVGVLILFATHRDICACFKFNIQQAPIQLMFEAFTQISVGGQEFPRSNYSSYVYRCKSS